MCGYLYLRERGERVQHRLGPEIVGSAEKRVWLYNVNVLVKIHGNYHLGSHAFGSESSAYDRKRILAAEKRGCISHGRLSKRTIFPDESPSVPQVSGNLALFEGGFIGTPALCFNDNLQPISLPLLQWYLPKSKITPVQRHS